MSQYTEIPFSGINNTNPDTLNDNGEVAAAFGVTSNGAVAAAAVPTATHLYNLPDNAKPLLIHSGSGYKNIFVYLPAAEDTDTDFKGRTVAYEYSELLADKGKDADGNIIAPAELCAESGRPTSTTTIGNIAVLSFSDKLRYAYRTADGYTLRPCKIPPLQLEIIAACRRVTDLEDGGSGWSLKAENFPDNVACPSGSTQFLVNENNEAVYTYDKFPKRGGVWTNWTGNEWQEQILGTFRSIIKKWGELGYFLTPVMLRAAYRLKSGELAGLTNPVLCFPHAKSTLCAYAYKDRSNWMVPWGVAYKPFGKFLRCADYDEWREIISSVDIFASTPIYTHSDNARDMFYDEQFDTSPKGLPFAGYPCYWRFLGNISGYLVQPGEIDTDPLSPRALESVSSFYKIASIPFDADINRDSVASRATAEDGTETVTYKWLLPADKTEIDDDYGNTEYGKEIYYRQGADGKFIGYRKLLGAGANGADISVTSEAIATYTKMTDQLRSNMLFSTNGVTSYNSRLILSGTEYAPDKETLPVSYFARCYGMFKRLMWKYSKNGYPNEMADDTALFYGEVYESASGNISAGTPKSETLDALKAFPTPEHVLDLSGGSGICLPGSSLTQAEIAPKFIAKAVNSATGAVQYFELDYEALCKTYNVLPSFLTCEEISVRELYIPLVEAGSADGGGWQPGIIGGEGRIVYLYTLNFKESGYLNLAMFTGELTREKMSEKKWTDEYLPLLSSAHRIGRSDYIRESDAADPYSFQSSNTAYLNSRVNRVLIVPEQISLGQYGQSQMYAVCDDGVYTVKVDDEGKLLSANTYTQDIIDHPERACVAAGQLTSNNTAAWDAYSQQQRTHLLDLARNLAFHFHRYPLIGAPPAWARWKTLLQDDKVYDFFRNATLRYDGRNNQLVAFRAGSGCIAALNADLGLTLLDCPAEYEVNAPWLVLADNDRNIYEFPDADPETASGKALIITRPIHLGSSRDALVTVRKAHVRGVFRKDCVHTALYGTRDYIHWHLVASSKTERIDAVSGSGYKAFAVAVYADLKGGEHLTHISLEHEEKRNARIPY